MTYYPKRIVIQKAIKNQIFFNYPGDLTGKTVTFRFKLEKEDAKTPLIEGNTTLISASSTISKSFFYLDLSQSEDLKKLIGNAWIDFKITFVDDPCPIVTFPTQVEIVTTLKGF